MNCPDTLAKLARLCAANTAIMKTKEERREELKRLAAMPNGIDKLYAILTRKFIPFEKLPIGTLMIEAILDHEYSEKRVT
jgi:hypothetical protein